jgi:hypothetical protein
MQYDGNSNLKNKQMKKIYVIIAFFSIMLITNELNAQCKVLLESIAGKYEGGCKKGKADGNGKAVGKDSYVGEFRKGLPHGQGTYTWSNGDVYVGSFKNGKKEGAGELTIKKGDKVIKGYWKDDEYIGIDKFVYKIYFKNPNILAARFSRKGAAPDEINFVFQRGGKVVDVSGFSLMPIEGSFGNIVDNGRSKLVKSVVYPFRANLIFEGKKMEFKINQPGSWKVDINTK